MHTINLRYLQQKSPLKSKLKSILLTFISVIFLTACGIKGDLYQTPEQAPIPNSTGQEQLNKNEEKNTEKSWNTLEEVVAQPDVPKSQQADKPSVEQTTTQSTDQEIEQQ